MSSREPDFCVDPLQFLERHLGYPSRNRQEALFECPFCKHHKKKLSVNVQSFCWKCWVCDAKGRSILSLVGRLPDKSVLAAYKAHFPQSLEAKPEEDSKDFVMGLPAEYVPLCQNADSYFGKKALRYLQQRKVTAAQIVRYKIGYAHSGKFASRLILPSFAADGQLNFFTGRTFVDDSFRYLNPATPKGYKNGIVMNELNIDWRRPVCLVEGFFDMLCADNAIPLFGSAVSEHSALFLSLVKHDPDIYVCLDADARSKQLQLLRTIGAYGLRCFDINVAPYKDLGEMPPEIFANKKNLANRCDKISILRERIKNSSA